MAKIVKAHIRQPRLATRGLPPGIGQIPPDRRAVIREAELRMLPLLLLQHLHGIHVQRNASRRAILKDERARGLIAARLNRLAYGLAGDVAPAGQGINELRIHHGPGYRVYFQNRGSAIVVLLCGGNKSTQAKDIVRTKRLAKEWME